MERAPPLDVPAAPSAVSPEPAEELPAAPLVCALEVPPDFSIGEVDPMEGAPPADQEAPPVLPYRVRPRSSRTQ